MTDKPDYYATTANQDCSTSKERLNRQSADEAGVVNHYSATLEKDLATHIDNVIGMSVTHPFPLTRRDYFAAIAMQGLMQSEYALSDADTPNRAVRWADALIRALDGPTEKTTQEK